MKLEANIRQTVGRQMTFKNNKEKTRIIKLVYLKQRKKILTKQQIRRSIDLLIKVANDLSNEKIQEKK